MATVHVHLRDGFAGEPVTVRVGGRTVLDEPALRTRPQLGLARIVDAEVAAGPVTVEVALPARGGTHAVTVDAGDAPVHVGVSVDDAGRLSHVVSPDGFGYV